jgi:hypothetical protein
MSYSLGGSPKTTNWSMVYTLKRAGGAWRLQESHK